MSNQQQRDNRRLRAELTMLADRLAAAEKVIAEAPKWVDIRKNFANSFIDTDYARELLKAADAAKSRAEAGGGTL